MYSHPNCLTKHIAICAAARQRQQDDVAVLSLALAADGQLQILPDGYFKATDGRPEHLPEGWLLNQTVADRLLAKLAQRKNSIVIDYEHQTFNSESNGQPAPAAGWIEPPAVEYRPGEGLFARCTWTEKAREFIRGGEYRYLSPVFQFDPETGEVLDLINIAITNNPALDGLAAIEALRKSLNHPSNQTQEDDLVKREELIKLLGLAQDATDEQIKVALAARLAAANSYTALCKELGLKEGEDPKAQVVALKSAATATPDPAKYVSVDVVESLKADVAALKANQTGVEVAALVKQGLDDGKLLPAQEPWAIELGNKDIAQLTSYLDKTPAIAALKDTQSGGKPPEGTDHPALDKEALAVCKQMGISPEDYIKYAPKKEES